MTISIAHTACTGVNDPTKQVSKDRWNENHGFVLDGQRMIGKPSAGPGPAEEMDANAVLSFAGASAAGHLHGGVYEPANANIQAHVVSTHAPTNAQANADITKAEIEAKLTGVIASHSHAGGGGAIVRSARVTANRTTTATGMANITDLAISILPSETVSFEAELHAGCNGTGGSQFSVTVPAGATMVVRAGGNTSSATAWTSGRITASDGASVTMLNVSAQSRRVYLRGVVVNGANSGSIQVRFKSVTSGQTTTVETNSYMSGRVH